MLVLVLVLVLLGHVRVLACCPRLLLLPRCTRVSAIHRMYCRHVLPGPPVLPAAGSLVEYFNKELVQGCKDAYIQK